MRRLKFGLYGLLAVGSLAGCTAIKVVTHNPAHQPTVSDAGDYRLDPQHWSIVFSVDHLGFSRFVMRFDKADAALSFDPAQPENTLVSATIAAASFDSNVRELDDIVRGEAVLDAAEYPEIGFAARQFHQTGPTSGDLDGTLTVRDRSTPVTLHVTFVGSGENPVTNAKTMGFRADGRFDRFALGMSRWYPAVGADIQLHIEAEFVERKR